MVREKSGTSRSVTENKESMGTWEGQRELRKEERERTASTKRQMDNCSVNYDTYAKMTTLTLE